MRNLSINDFYSIAHGSCFFASGGGGSLITALQLIQEMSKKNAAPSVDIVTVAEALDDPDCIAASIAFMGAPDGINIEYPPQDILLAFKDLNEAAIRRYGKPITYLIPIETGALNIAAAYIVAYEMNKNAEGEKIKVIDADGAGRSVPTLTLLTYSTNNVSCDPSILSRVYNPQKKPRFIKKSSISKQEYTPVSIYIENSDASQVEDMTRDLMSNSDIFQQFGGLGIWLMDRDYLRVADPVEGGITKSLRLGESLRMTNLDYDELGLNKKNILFQGTLIDIKVSTSGGFDLGVAEFQNVDGVLLYIYLQNENIIAWKNDNDIPVIMAPDSICYISHEFVQPENCPEKIRVFSNSDNDWKAFLGKKIDIVGLQADNKLKSKEMDEMFAQLRSKYGYPGKYRDFSVLE